MTDPGLVFGALADDTRRTVFVRVAASGQATASELARDLPVTRQAVAKHLSLLASAGLVESERVGRETRFHARSEPLSEAIDWMAGVGARWDDRLARLAKWPAPSELPERGRTPRTGSDPSCPGLTPGARL